MEKEHMSETDKAILKMKPSEFLAILKYAEAVDKDSKKNKTPSPTTEEIAGEVWEYARKIMMGSIATNEDAAIAILPDLLKYLDDHITS